ncbi:hypothetical protein D9758_011173 [Tetrapyrgos nigripes]|uniref:Uncharacterized protein n=1 Tax=Tetrapyrgos nigripes TaxID=182062 RepID=A0A8H5D7B7_9AGAR|nr:hypothetical protein D9758_011173 [Tetrapyrgos nigripes]
MCRILVIVNVAVVVDSLSLEPIAPPTITLGQPFTVTWHRNVQADPTDWFLLLGTPFFNDFLGQIVFDVPNSEAPDGTLTGSIPTTGVETGSMQIVAGERSLPNGKPWATPVTSIQVVRTDVALTSQHRNTDTASSTSRPQAVSPTSTSLPTKEVQADSTSDASSR